MNCTPLQATPGSVTIGASGFIRVQCPGGSGAAQFGIPGLPSTTLTPTFTLGIGYTNASIISASGPNGSPCSFTFGSLTVGNVTVTTGSFLNHPITFGNPPTSSTQLLAGAYNYCLQYQNAPSTGLPGFDIVWT